MKNLKDIILLNHNWEGIYDIIDKKVKYLIESKIRADLDNEKLKSLNQEIRNRMDNENL